MNYTVVWRREAESQLIAHWIRAANKEAIAGYVDQIDRILARDPSNQGESRNVNTRLAFFRPLCVRYHMDETAKRVTVLAIKWVGR
jgi:pantothenate kinase-related protein Tda10